MFIYYLIAVIGFLWLVKRFTSLMSVPLEQSIISLNISIPNVPGITVDKVTESSMVLHWSSFDDDNDNSATNNYGSSTGVSTKRESNSTVVNHSTTNSLPDGPPLLVNNSPNTISQYVLYVNGIQTAVIEGNQQSCILEGLQSGNNYQVDIVAFNVANFRSKSSPIYVRTTKAENLSEAVNAEQLNHPDSLLTVLAREKDTDQIFKHPSYRQHSPHGRRSRSNTVDGPNPSNLENGTIPLQNNNSSYANNSTDLDYIVQNASTLTDIDELKFWLEVMLEEVRNLLRSYREDKLEFEKEENSLLVEKEEAMARRKMEAVNRSSLKSEIKSWEESRRKAETKVTLNQNKYRETVKKIDEKKSQISKWRTTLQEKRISNETILKNSESELLKLKQQVEEYNKQVFSIQEELHNMEEDNKEYSATKKKLDAAEKQLKVLFESFKKGIDEKSGLVTNDGKKAFDQIVVLKPEWKEEYEKIMKEDAQAESQWRALQQKEYHRAAQIKKQFDLFKSLTSKQNSSTNSLSLLNNSNSNQPSGSNGSAPYTNNSGNNTLSSSFDPNFNSNTYSSSQNIDDRFNLVLMRAYNSLSDNGTSNSSNNNNGNSSTVTTNGYPVPPPLTHNLSSSSFNNLGINDDSMSTNAPGSLLSASPHNQSYWGSGLSIGNTNGSKNLQIDTALSKAGDYGYDDEELDSPDVAGLLPHALIEGEDADELFQGTSSPRPTSQLLGKALDESSESPRGLQGSNFDVLSSYSEIGAVSINNPNNTTNNNNNGNDAISVLSGSFLPPFGIELGGLTHTPTANSRITSLNSLQPMTGFNSPPTATSGSGLGNLTTVESRVSNNYLDLSTQKSPFAPSNNSQSITSSFQNQHSKNSSIGTSNEESSNAFSPKRKFGFGKSSMLDFFSNNNHRNDNANDLAANYNGNNKTNDNSNTSHNKSSLFSGFMLGSQYKTNNNNNNDQNDKTTSTISASVKSNGQLEDPSASPVAINVFPASYDYKKSLDLSLTRGRSTSFGSSIWNNNNGVTATNSGEDSAALSSSPTGGLTWGGSYNPTSSIPITSSLTMSQLNPNEAQQSQQPSTLGTPINIIGNSVSGTPKNPFESISNYTVDSVNNESPHAFTGIYDNQNTQQHTSDNTSTNNSVLHVPSGGHTRNKTNASSSTHSMSSSSHDLSSEHDVEKPAAATPSSPQFFKKKLQRFNFGTSPTKIPTKESDRSYISSHDETASSEDDHGNSLNLSDHSVNNNTSSFNAANNNASNSYSLLGSSIGSKSSNFFNKLSTRRNSHATSHSGSVGGVSSIGNNTTISSDGPNENATTGTNSNPASAPLSSGNGVNSSIQSGTGASSAITGVNPESATSTIGSSNSGGGIKITRRISLAFKRNEKNNKDNTIIEENVEQAAESN